MIAKTGKDRQAALKERYRTAGLLQRTYWVTPEQEQAIQRLLETDQQRERRERREADERRKAVFLAQLPAIKARLAAGEKPTAVAAWLNEAHGWEGSGAALNGLLRAGSA